MEEKKLKITLVKSLITRIPAHRKIVHALGIKKIGESVIMPDTPATRGILNKVGFLMKVEEL
ncbi:MAG: 50S ribosomal protein L30 [Eubacteriaceae bacterium]|nr:50S ribosomal protein L30 [Eubacteriaceae bacterium]MBR5995494.1 50S ribosomal protein L30 [Eubacteriaceae bacterium]